MLCTMTSPTLRRQLLFWTIGVTLTAGGVLARGLAAAQAGGEGVAVDFFAVSSDGKPIADLKPEEVSLKIAGKARPIKSLKLVRYEAGAGGAASALPAPFATNGGDSGGGRSFMLVIEDESLRPGGERDLRDEITRFLDTLSSRDRVALSTAPRDVARVGFGAGVPKAKEALAQVNGRLNSGASDSEKACRTRDTLLSLRNQLDALAGSDTPTTVVVFSSQMTVPSGTSASINSGGCDLTTDHFKNLGPAVAAARANVYVVQQDPSVTQRNDGLENLAGVTSAGTVLRLAMPGGPLARIAGETAGYYVATVDPDNSDRPGQSQRLELKVSRDGVVTRSRSEFVASRTAPAAAGAKSAAVDPKAMMRETRAFRDLPIRAVAYASRAGADKMAVLVMAEPADPAVKFNAATAAVIDPASNKIVVQLSADEKQLAGSPIVLSMPVAAGTYRVRFGATDASGKSGAVDYPLVAELTPAGPLKLGALVLTSFRNNAAVPAVQFRDEEKIIGILEVYGQLTGQVSARMELASSADGPALATIQPGGRTTNEPDKAILTAEIPINTLAPGDYVVRAYVAIQGQPEGKVVKTFRKAAK